MSQALVASGTRTSVRFAVHGDPWAMIAAWAQRHRFYPRETPDARSRVFQRGSGFWTAPMRAHFTVQGNHVELQAWVHVPLFTRIMSLFLLPAEMRLESGGFRGAVPRKLGRNAVNDLLAQVGAPPIP